VRFDEALVDIGQHREGQAAVAGIDTDADSRGSRGGQAQGMRSAIQRCGPPGGLSRRLTGAAERHQVQWRGVYEQDLIPRGGVEKPRMVA
jgi:hypothetical protein